MPVNYYQLIINWYEPHILPCQCKAVLPREDRCYPADTAATIPGQAIATLSIPLAARTMVGSYSCTRGLQVVVGMEVLDKIEAVLCTPKDKRRMSMPVPLDHADLSTPS